VSDYQNAVETSDLTRRFGSFVAVDNVQFSIPKGEIFGLLGPNGAGKTTTIRMLCGILAPTSGKASVLGYDVVRKAEEIKKRIGYMSQRFSLYNDLTVWENAMFYTSIYGVPREERAKRVKELLEISGLQGLEGELTKNLSGGWRQRLALSCSIAHQPPMLFLDEPTAGVDPVSRREFWDLIYEMAGQDVSVLATTHYMDEAEYCNTVGMMYRGRLIAIDSPDGLRAKLPGKLIKVECDDPASALELVRKEAGVLEASYHGVQLHLMMNNGTDKKRIQRVLQQAKITIHNLEEIRPSLEDVFISLVEEQYRDEVRQGISLQSEGER